MASQLHTTHGDLKLELFCDSCPKTCYNFLVLCASSAYTGTVFHRSVPGFILQGGSADTSGKGKTSESVFGAPFEDEIRAGLKHSARGVLAMANSGPGTNGSQFYVTYKAAPSLDGTNTVFGRVIDGKGTGQEDTLGRIERVDVDRKHRPRETVRIEEVTIHANPMADLPGPP